MLILKKVKPLSDNVITTGNRYDEVYSSGGILDPNKSGSFKEYQTVLFSSDAAVSRGVNVGDTVLVNLYNYARPIQKKDSIKSDMDEYYSQQLAFSIPTIDINKKECLSLRANDIQLVILEMEEIN
jgi:co-chaperonin GroES (HSP10)